MTVDDQAAERGHCFAGRWRSPEGCVHVIARCGDELELESVSTDTDSMHGRGTIIDDMAVIEVIDALGNAGRLEVTLTDDGAELTGRYAGPMGPSAIRLTRQG